MNPQIRVHDEGQTENYTIEEYADDGGSLTTAARLFEDNALYAEEELASRVRHNEGVVERAHEEDDVVVARISVPFWFRDDDEEVAETFDGDDAITALVEDYSEKAWRIIASETNMGRTGVWYNYEWTFVPKSLATVTTAAGFADAAEAREATDEARELRRERRESRDAAFEEADGWEEKLEVAER